MAQGEFAGVALLRYVHLRRQKARRTEFPQEPIQLPKTPSKPKGWKYIGAWERSPEKQRLHFHTLLYIPDGNEVGELKEVNDYDTISHKRQITYQNTFFLERYGRNDFKPICKQDLGDTVGYLMKYIGKSNERLTYSRNLPQYFVSDILDKDVICGYGVEDRKLLLGDSFDCFIDGEHIGQVSPEVIAKMPKAN